MERYITLVTQTYRDEDNVPIDETEEDNQDGLQILIDKNLESISGYTTKFHDIRRANIETFRVIDTMLIPSKEQQSGKQSRQLLSLPCQAVSSSTQI